MLCYFYPPASASGVVRSVAFAERLPSFGWQPTVLTVSKARDVNLKHGEEVPAAVPVVRTTELNFEGLLEVMQGVTNRSLGLFGRELPDKFFRQRIAIPDAQIAWLASPAGIRLARRSSVVYVSCSPFSAALQGCLIKRITGRPLVVDFRDAWTLNPHSRYTPFHRRAIDRLEASVVRQADHVILNTPGALRLYQRRYPELAGKMSVIPNGYDELNEALPSEPVREPFRIMHVGAFYGSRTPDALLEALAELGDRVEFVQVGHGHPSFSRFAGRANFRVVDQVRHADALKMMRTASLLYLKQGTEPGVSDYIAVAAKTYEYLATGLPILAECPEGDNADLVRRYAAKSYVITDQPAGPGLRAALAAAYRERFCFSPQVTADFLTTFDRARLTRTLAGVLDSVAGGQGAEPPVRAER